MTENVTDERQLLVQFKANTNWFDANFEKLREKYAQRYVAVDNNEIVGSDKNFNQLMDKLKKAKIDVSAVFIRFIQKKGIIEIL